MPVPPPGKGGKYWLFIKLITDDGIEGTGECTWHGTHRRSALQVAQEIFESILKGADPMRRERIWWDVFRRHAVLHTGPIATPVLSAIDMACWDIAGKALGEPVYNLLGGLFHDKLRAYTYLYGWKMGDPPEKAAEDILRYIDRGFTAVKLDPVGALEPHRLETLTYVEGVIRAMREAAGDRCDILIGTHGQLTTHAAIRLAKRLEPYEPLWFEEPVAPGNIDEMARVAHATSIPVATDERLMTRYEFLPLLQKQAASIIQMDLSITGGISETRKIATMAETHYAHIAPHVWGGPFAAAAAIHVDVCSPNFLIHEGIETFSEFHRDILTEPIVWQDGHIIPPTAPVELYVLSSLRTLHAVPLKNVRSAIAYLRETAQTDHPLADCDLLTDRFDLFVEKTGEYLNISRAGQLEMKAQLLRCMKQVDRGVDGLPNRLRLLDPKNESIVAAEVDPEIRFGQPRIPDTGIPTAIIYQSRRAGETAEQLAAVYERRVAEVTSAISYEESSRAA